MAITIIENRTTLDQADANTNFNTGDAHTTIYAEATGCVAYAYNIATGQIYYNSTTPDMTAEGNKLIYLWSACIATQNSYKEATPSDSSHAMFLGDGADEIIIYMAGNDRDVFKHADGQVTFQCFMVDMDYLDTLNADGDLAAISGTYAGFDPTSTTLDVGSHYTTLSKALGGGVNCYIDIIRYGTGGITIVGGTDGDPGKFSEIAEADRSTADGAAHGICREYTPGSYGVQGTLQFGDHGTSDAIFVDSGIALTFEDRPVSDDKFKILYVGDSTNTNKFNISNSSVVSARPGVEIDVSSNDIDVLDFASVSFVNLLNPLSFPYDSDVYDHSVSVCSFANCGQVAIGSAEFRNCSFSETAADSTSLEAAVLWEFGYADIQDCGISDCYYGIAMDSTGDETITFTDIRFTNNTYDVLWLGTGTLTISIVGGDTPTYYTPNGGTVVIIQAIDWYFEIQDQNGDIVNTAEFRIYDSNDNELYGVETSDGTEKYTFNGTISGTSARIVTHDLNYLHYTQTLNHPSTSNTADAPVVITLVVDRVYDNPTIEKTRTWGKRSTDDYKTSIDSYTDSGAATTNYGSSEDLIFESANTRVLFSPKIANGIIPSHATITSATLYYYIYANNISASNAITILQLKRDWVEDEVTYNEYSSGNAWEADGGIGANDIYSGTGDVASIAISETGWVSFDLTQDIQDWIDGVRNDMYGWLGVTGPMGGGQSIDIRSSEYVADTTLRPYLEIVWSQ